MNGEAAEQLVCRPMTGAERLDAFNLYKSKISDEARLGAALALFADREDLGMVWLALDEGRAVAACTVSYEIGLREGVAVARIAEIVVEPGRDRDATARRLLETLHDALKTRGITSVNAGGAFA